MKKQVQCSSCVHSKPVDDSRMSDFVLCDKKPRYVYMSPTFPRSCTDWKQDEKKGGA